MSARNDEIEMWREWEIAKRRSTRLRVICFAVQAVSISAMSIVTLLTHI